MEDISFFALELHQLPVLASSLACIFVCLSIGYQHSETGEVALDVITQIRHIGSKIGSKFGMDEEDPMYVVAPLCSCFHLCEFFFSFSLLA